MKPQEFVDFLSVIEKLKCRVRHGWTSSGRRESVAEHSWRLAAAAMLLREEFPELDIDKAIKMALVHDWGEAVTGDIPTFYKTKEDEAIEGSAIEGLLKKLPIDIRDEYSSLFWEFERQATEEARFVKALDKIEAVLQHNEADISTWIPLEYELNANYGEKEASRFPYLSEVRKNIRDDTVKKVEKYKKEIADGGVKELGTVSLESGRLVLRRLVPEDAQNMFNNWASDPKVTKYLTWPAYSDVDGVKKYLNILLRDYDDNETYNWGIEIKETGQVVGTIGVVSRNKNAGSFHVGYCLGCEWWGRGIMTEALTAVIKFLFDEMGALRVESRHDTNNPNSGKVMSNCGMTKEGVLRGSDKSNNGIGDMAWYGILRDEYYKQG